MSEGNKGRTSEEREDLDESMGTTSLPVQVPNPGFTLPYTLFSSQGVILWSLQRNTSKSYYWSSSLFLPSLLIVCSCPATSALQALQRDLLFSKSAQWTGLAAVRSIFATFFAIFFSANLHMSWTEKGWNFILRWADTAIRVAFFVVCFNDLFTVQHQKSDKKTLLKWILKHKSFCCMSRKSINIDLSFESQLLMSIYMVPYLFIKA